MGGQQQHAEYLFRHLDLKWMRDNADALEASTRARKIEGVDVRRVVALYDRFARSEFDLRQLRAQRNRLAEELKELKKRRSRGKIAVNEADEAEEQDLINRGKALREQLHLAEREVKETEAELYREAKRVPNVHHPDVPVGSEEKARVVGYGGPPKREINEFGFEALDHVALCQRLDLVSISPSFASVRTAQLTGISGQL